MYVPIGSRLTYVAEYDVTLLSRIALTAGDILSAVASDLKNSQNILVESSNLHNTITDIKTTFTLKLKTNDGDHAAEGDVQSIVDHYFYTETGEFPASSRITQVTPPNATPVDTGAPSAPPDDPNNSNPSNSILDGFFSSFSGIGVGLFIGAGIVVGGLFLLASVESRA